MKLYLTAGIRVFCLEDIGQCGDRCGNFSISTEEISAILSLPLDSALEK